LNPRSEDPVASLPDPLSTMLRDPVDERAVARLWRGVEERRRVPAVRLGAMVGWATLGAAIAIVSMLALGFVTTTTPARGGRVAVQEPGPLLRADGTPVVPVEVATAATRVLVSLADRSRIAVEPGSRLEPLASSAHEFVVRLARGTVTFDVEPKGPRRWIIEAGIASVEVVGTRFTVTRMPSSVRVVVARGVVLVRGSTVPDGVARLEAGRSLDVRAPAEKPEHDGGGVVRSAAPHPERVPSSLAGKGWRDRVRAQDYAHAYDLLGTEGLELETARAASADDLFTLADVARLSGHPDGAVLPLERLLSTYPSSERAALAAVTLGRIELGLGAPEKASVALERALALGVPAGLEEDVMARLVEADVKAGNRARASAVATDYARRFPAGRRQTDIDRWVAR
jgi:transmembrane sensor